MNLKILRYIVDGNGNYIKVPVKGIVAQEDSASKIQVISPVKGSLAVGFTVYDSVDEDMIQYLPLQDYLANELLDPTDQYYQTTYEWYVYEAEIRHKHISNISKHHSGRVGISFTFRQAVEQSPNALNYLGTFGRNRIPVEANDGDFIVCEYWNFNWGDEVLTKGDILYWFDGEWHLEPIYLPVLNTQKINIPIDPSVYAYSSEEDLDITELEQLWLSVGNIQDKVFGVLDSGTRIHITGEEIDRAGLTVIDKDEIDVADKIVKDDLIISKNIMTSGYVGRIAYTTAIEAVVEFVFILGESGGSKNLVFETEEQLMDWIDGLYVREDLYTVDDLFIGQLLFIEEVNVPDYWVKKTPVDNINDLAIQESDQTFDRTAVGETEPSEKYGIWIDTSEPGMEPFGTFGFDYNYPFTEDPGYTDPIEEEQTEDRGDDSGMEEQEVEDVGDDSGVELPGGGEV